MPASSIEPVDLLDLKLLPAWVNEQKNYAHYKGDEGGPVERASIHPRRGKDRPSRKAKPPHAFKKTGEGGRRLPARRVQDRQGKDRHKPFDVASQVAIHFLPRGPAVENVAAQIKSGSVAYSLFAKSRSATAFVWPQNRTRLSIKLERAEPFRWINNFSRAMLFASRKKIFTRSTSLSPIRSKEIFRTSRDAN
ncbi:MAG: hypothetical protein DMF17_07845 [Verrucomicrobia bacterium]|nr:MAG: hypothetical protein DMF17_07845 [Verrucomicrobiota bacterium]